jgi:zinc protease
MNVCKKACFFLMILFLSGCGRMKLMDVTRTSLDNGMIVLILERHSAPVVAINTLVHTGYFNEPDSLTGISHLLEHMFFKGTKKRVVGQLREETKRLGGYLNAGTIYEYTHYYTVLPGEFIQQGLELQSDALWNSVIDSAALEKEKKVVIEEVKRKLDNPEALAWEKLMELAFDQHPIRRWRMGTPEQIESWSRDQFERYFKSYYRPDNIVLSIVGDVKAESVLEGVRRYYGNVKMEKTEKPQIPQEPSQKELRYSQMKGDITQSYLKMGFHIPGKLKKDFFTLDVLAHILGDGRSSRLSQSLLERKKLVSAIKSDVFALKDLGFFMVEAELDAKDLLKAEIEIFLEIERIKQQKISDHELAKAKNAIKFSYLSSIETSEGQSENLAVFESYGDYRLGEQYLSNVEKVTGDDIEKVASEYLTLKNVSILEYRPDKDFDLNLTVPRIKEAIVEGLKKGFDEGERFELALSFSRPIKTFSVSGESVAKKAMLSCGVMLITKENHSLPLASVGIYFKGGRANETKENCGITRLTLKGCLKGTESKSATEIFNLLEMLGASLETEVEADYCGYLVRLLSANLEPGLDIMADVIKNPVFDPEELEKEKKILLAEIEKNKDNMQDYPIRLFYQATFPDHPYGLNGLGEKEAVEKLNAALVKEWHRSHFSDNNMTIVAVGDFDSSFLKQKLENLLEGLRKEKATESKIPFTFDKISDKLDFKSKEKTVVENRLKAQTAQALGFATCSYSEEDLYALKVLQAIASGAGGRFFHQLREKKGLAYTVYGVNDSWGQAGAFYAYIATSPQNEELAREDLASEFYKFKTDSVKDEELEAAKRYITGMYRILLETNSAQVKQYAKSVLLGSGIEEVERYPRKINEVTKEQVKEVAKKYFDPKNLAFGVIRGKK